MATIQKRLVFSLVIIGMVLAFSACQPEADTTDEIERIVLSNVPVNMYRTKAGEDSEAVPVFKVFAQLSDAFTPNAVDVSLGWAIVEPTKEEIKKGVMTVTIENWDVRSEGTEWKAVAFLISPENVNDIFDVDFHAGTRGLLKSEGSTTYADWKGKTTFTKHTMITFGGYGGGGADQGMENLRRLYGEKSKDGNKDGIICYWDNKDKYGGKEIKGSKTRADPAVIDSIDLFNKKND